MARYFLKKIGLTKKDWTYGITFFDKRKFKYWKQRRKYGFDERDTWALNLKLAEFLYERLSLYKKLAGKVIWLDFHKELYNGAEISFEQAIDLMIDKLAFYIKESYGEESEEANKAYEEVLDLIKIFHRYLWW